MYACWDCGESPAKLCAMCDAWYCALHRAPHDHPEPGSGPPRDAWLASRLPYARWIVEAIDGRAWDTSRRTKIDYTRCLEALRAGPPVPASIPFCKVCCCLPHHPACPNGATPITGYHRPPERPPNAEHAEVLRWLLERIGSWTTARFDQHARNEFGDERTDAFLRWLETL